MRNSTKTGIGLMAAVTIACYSATSTVRGAIGMQYSISENRSVAAKIRKHKAAPDCLKNENRVVKALDSVVGKKDAKKIAKNIRPAIEEYEEEMEGAKTEKERENASYRLVGAIQRELLNNAYDNATPLEIVDAWGTMITMIAMPDASSTGAQDAVFGWEANVGIRAIAKECKD